jgi:hypothetical protein
MKIYINELLFVCFLGFTHLVLSPSGYFACICRSPWVVWAPSRPKHVKSRRDRLGVWIPKTFALHATMAASKVGWLGVPLITNLVWPWEFKDRNRCPWSRTLVPGREAAFELATWYKGCQVSLARVAGSWMQAFTPIYSCSLERKKVLAFCL